MTVCDLLNAKTFRCDHERSQNHVHDHDSKTNEFKIYSQFLYFISERGTLTEPDPKTRIFSG